MARVLRDVAPWHARLLTRSHWSYVDFHGHAWNRVNPALKVRRTLHGRSVIDKPTQPQFSVRRYGGAAKREALSNVFRRFRDADQSAEVVREGVSVLKSVEVCDFGTGDDIDSEMAGLYLNACRAFSCPPSSELLRDIAMRVLPKSDHAQAVESIVSVVGASRIISRCDRTAFYSLVASTPHSAEVLLSEGSSAACCVALTWLTEYVPTEPRSSVVSDDVSSSTATVRNRLINKIQTKLLASSTPSLAELATFVFSLIGERCLVAREEVGRDILEPQQQHTDVVSGTGQVLTSPTERFRFLDQEGGDGGRGLVLQPSLSALVPVLMPVLLHSMDQLFPMEAAGFFYFLLTAASQTPGFHAPTDAIISTALDAVDALAHRLYVMSDMVAEDVHATALVLAAIAGHDFACQRYKKLPRALRHRLALLTERLATDERSASSQPEDSTEVGDEDGIGGARTPLDLFCLTFCEDCLVKIGLPPLGVRELLQTAK